MSKFFVGQRVRIVRATRPVNNGITGRIAWIKNIRSGEICPNGLPLERGREIDCWIILDSRRHDGLKEGGNAFWQLEPILPEGSAPSVYTFQQLMDSLQEAVA